MSDSPLAPLLGQLKESAMDELHQRLHDQGYEEIRPGPGRPHEEEAFGSSSFF